MARSTYYYCVKKLTLTDRNVEVKARITAIYHQHRGRYGYRRIAAVLKQTGLIINHKKVLSIMKDCGLKSMVRIKKYRSYKGQIGEIAKNLLNRNFKAKKPFCKLVTDVTEFAVGGEKLYLSPVMDLYNSEIISYNLSSRPTFYQTMDMLKKVINKLPTKARPILHSDQGWQYQMRQYQEALKNGRIKQSMSRKGNCLDNAPMENFFSIIKSELYYPNKFDSIEALKRSIERFINYYNNKRIKLKLNGLSPVQYRTQAA